MTFRLAHLSDPHVGPLPKPRLSDLAGKRLTGYWNWHNSRHTIHNMDVLDTITADIIAQQPDHVALTGDLVNIGLPAEFPIAGSHLDRLGGAEHVSVIPGNHDAYVCDSLPAMRQTHGAFMRDDAGSEQFPYLRTRGPLALIGVSSAVPTLPFLATGRVGAAQLKAFDAMLASARKTHRGVVVMIHHPPHRGGARFLRQLWDADKFEAILRKHGADLVIHGHNHRLSVAHLTGPHGRPIPIVGVASASAVPGSPAHRAAYHLFHFDDDTDHLRIKLDVRGMEAPEKPVELLQSIVIAA